MELLENYNEAIKQIYDHVGFTQDWVIFPIDDCTNKFWSINDAKNKVRYADGIDQFKYDGVYYEDEIYKQRFYSKWVYEGDNFTMIFCDPNVDGMRWFRIFDNSKRTEWSEIEDSKNIEIKSKNTEIKSDDKGVIIFNSATPFDSDFVSKEHPRGAFSVTSSDDGVVTFNYIPLENEPPFKILNP